MIAVLALIAGVVLGVVLEPTVPAALQPYLPIAVVAALDAVFGGVRAKLDGIFDDKQFVDLVHLQRAGRRRSSSTSATSSASAASCPPAWSSCSACASSATWRRSAATCSGRSDGGPTTDEHRETGIGWPARPPGRVRSAG